ncbi:MAG: universal stress protein [Desulfatiglandaceae bacterium]
MTQVNRMLFGVDDSDFSRTSLAAVGKLIAINRKFRIQIFHGSPDMRIISAKHPYLSYQPTEENLRRFNAESKKCLNKARKALMDAGVEEENISDVLEENCTDPAGAMLDLAEAERFDVVGLARFGADTIGRHVIGSISYRVASSSEKVPVWIVDHRAKSRHFLVCLVGAPIGQRIIDHVAIHFSHLHDSRFTLFHVIPPFTLQADRIAQYMSKGTSTEEMERLTENMNLRLKRAEETLETGKRKLIDAGIPEQNVDVKKQPQDQGIARDILTELETGGNGILVAGRKGSGDIREFGLGSKAYKLLCAARPFMLCLVN